MMLLRRMMMAGSGAPPLSSLRDAILADSPYWYLRLNDAAGPTAVGEVSARNGFYSPSGVLYQQPALYTGGAVSITVNGSTSGANVAPTNMPAAYDVCSYVTVWKPGSTGSALRQIATHGDGASTATQAWQFRTSSGALEFIKITGGVSTYNTGASLTGGQAYILGFDVAVDGSNRRLTVYVNGSAVYTTVFATANFGAVTGAGIGIGAYYSFGYSLGTDNGISDAAFFASPIGAARHLAYAQAAGFA